MDKKEFIDKYGDVVVMFSVYYKYTFTYTALLAEGESISVSIGGNADDIYRESVSNNETIDVRSLDPYQGSVYKDKKELFGFYDY